MEGSRVQPMVRWYSPRQLIRTLSEVMTSSAMMRLLDPRIVERRQMEPRTFPSLSGPAGGARAEGGSIGDEGCPFFPFPDDRRKDKEVWIDYLADTGDGWNSTFSVARTLARDVLALKDAALGERELPRAQILVLGGDLVYPTPRDDNYDKRLLAPFREAFEKSAAPHPIVLAIPGNHDWYDGLSAFTQRFCYPGNAFAGWVTRQTRSYFALPLPGNWWLLGVDSQLGNELDRPQLEYFKHVAGLMPPDARVILCMPSPDWLEPATGLLETTRKPSQQIAGILGRGIKKDVLERMCAPAEGKTMASPESPAILDQCVRARPGPPSAPEPAPERALQPGAFDQIPLDEIPPDRIPAVRETYGQVVNALGRPVEVCLAGDLHHYQRHETIPRHEKESPRVRITAGGGGAFLHATHAPLDRCMRDRLVRKKSFPSAPESRRYRKRLLAFPYLNPTFGIVTAILYVFLALNVLDADAPIRSARGFFGIYLRGGGGAGPAWGTLLMLALGSALILAFRERRSKLSLLLATGHLAAQLAAIAVVSSLAVNLGLRWIADPLWTRVAFTIGLIALGGYLVGAALMGLYLWVSVLCNRLLHEAYSALRIEDWKCFLRLRVQEDGTLTIYPIGLQRVARHWARRTGTDGESRLRPDDARVTPPELIEMPIVIPPEGNAGAPGPPPAPPA